MRKNTNHSRGSRRLILIDPENLAARPYLDGADVLRIHSEFERSLPIHGQDIVYVGGHLGNALPCGTLASLLHGQICLRNGPDGADLALLERAKEVPENAFCSTVYPIVECVIASGDGGFTSLAQVMKARGLKVTALSRSMSMSRQLASVVDNVIYLDRPNAPAASVAA